MHTLENIYRDAIYQLYAKENKHSAKEYFRLGYARDPNSCDFYRGMLACTTDANTVDDQQLTEVYSRADTFGDLSRAVEVPEAFPRLNYDMKWMALWLEISSVKRLHAIEAIRRVNADDYSGADDVLERHFASDVASPHSFALLARTYLHYKTKRWGDVLVHGEALTRVAALDAMTDEPARNDEGKLLADKLLNAAGFLMLGEAAAHLSRFEEAVARLEVAARSDNVFIKSDALRVHGLVLRAQGDKEGARQMLAQAATVAETPQLREALSNELLYLPATTEELIMERSSYWDYSTEPSLRDREADNRNDHLKQMLDEAEQELARQIGMREVKEEVERLKVRARFNLTLKERGLSEQASSNHLILTGPPGTGKTTIARVIAKIYAGYGVVDVPEVMETSRQDFVAEYEGQSASRTADTFRKARGKVLFIDEAYELIQDRDGRADAFGQEAVTVMLQEMENHRDDTVVIIAGYEGDIKRFLATNDGLASRFSSWIRFDSYSPEELAEIAQVIARSRNDIFGEDAFNAVVEGARDLEYSDHRGVRLIDKLGNGRFARNLVEKAAAERLDRFREITDLSVLTDEDLLTITAADVTAAVEALKTSAQ